MEKPIAARVAEILSDRMIVISAGAREGVTVGMRFAVLALGDEVKDPATGESLGRCEVPKGRLVASHVQERMTLCEGVQLWARPHGDAEEQVLSAAMISASMRPGSWGGDAERLDVNRRQMRGLPSARPVSVGDLVRQVVA
jgi:hypothetical protein